MYLCVWVWVWMGRGRGRSGGVAMGTGWTDSCNSLIAQRNQLTRSLPDPQRPAPGNKWRQTLLHAETHVTHFHSLDPGVPWGQQKTLVTPSFSTPTLNDSARQMVHQATQSFHLQRPLNGAQTNSPPCHSPP